MNVRKIFATAFTASILAGSLAGTALASTGNQTDGTITIEPKADDQTLTVVITGGDFGTQDYSFTNKTYDTEDDFVVNVRDPRGTNKGWTVNISGTAFTSDAASFAVGNLVLVDASDVTATAGDATDVDVKVSSATTLTMSSTPTPILSAANGSGAGEFEVEFDAELTVPGLQIVGDYTSVITVDLTAAPGA
jgi:hypothetical protein